MKEDNVDHTTPDSSLVLKEGDSDEVRTDSPPTDLIREPLPKRDRKTGSRREDRKTLTRARSLKIRNVPHPDRVS